MKVLVIGSGLVGTAAAIALQRTDHDCTVYDQVNLPEAQQNTNDESTAVDFGETGGSVLLAPDALRVVRDLGLFQEVFDYSSPSYYTHFQKIDGRSQIVLKTQNLNARIEPEVEFQAPRQIMRSKLHRILVTAAYKAGVKTVTGKKAIHIEETDQGYNVYFEDGTHVNGDLVVGADGIHSVTRRQIFGESCKAKFTGTIGYIGVVDLQANNIKLDQTLAFFIDRTKKRMVCTYKVSKKLAAVQVMTFDDPDPEEDGIYRPYSDLPKHATRLGNLINAWGLPSNVVEMMRKSFRIAPASIYDLPDLKTYHKGRVVLLGDSAHGMVPNAGLGLGAGLADVGVLAELMKRFPDDTDLDTVLRLYSKIRVPAATNYAKYSRNVADQYYSATFGATFNHFMMRIFVGAMNAGVPMAQPFKEVYDCSKVVIRAIEAEKFEQN
ncbi:hypothetical protein HK100_000095 [Physocladia obscura]|uniref:FAD-binding domain-containing protein n=1 Tax=Physocladia obscura TaxID=109957 RepID=A0AAD5XFG3_9FUNG|nr:hypothetical protein HK100_000095 [Physocladia obscura]